MLRRPEIGLLFLLFLAAPVLAHQPILLDARRATPGLRLEMHELQQFTPALSPKYQLKAFGFPPGSKVLLWAKEFDHTVRQMGSVFEVVKSGSVLEAKSIRGNSRRRLEDLVFEPGSYPQGAVWEVALVSVDRKLQAYAKAIPDPISARDGTCELTLQLVSHRGEKFLVSGSGFIAGDEVTVESRYGGRISEKRVRISTAGLLPPQVLLHVSRSGDDSAGYKVKGRSCDVEVEYKWGDAALKRQHPMMKTTSAGF